MGWAVFPKRSRLSPNRRRPQYCDCDLTWKSCQSSYNQIKMKSYWTRVGLNPIWASQVVLMIKNLPANEGDIRNMGSFPGSWRSPEEGMTTHSSTLAWRIPWTVESGSLQSIVSQKVGHSWSNLALMHNMLIYSYNKYIYTYICIFSKMIVTTSEK